MTAQPLGDAEAIIGITRSAAEPRMISDRLVWVSTAAGGKLIDLADYGLGPANPTIGQTLYDPDSFLLYVARSHDLDVWADETAFEVVAVMDSRMPDSATPGWARHRATLVMRTTRPWETWRAHDGKMTTQETFAEFLEDNQADVAEPDAAILLEIAQSFRASSKATFESTQILANGQRALEYREDVEATAGKKGNIQIPATIAIGVRPFIGSDAYRVTARLRWRITNGTLQMGYKLDRPDEVERRAFREVVDVIRDGRPDATPAIQGVGVPILNGRPS